MSTVNNIGSSDPIQRLINNPIQKSIPTVQADGASPPRAADRLELSGTGQLFQTLQQNNIRTDKVASVRAQIDAGTYEDDQKLDVAAGKLLEDLST